MFIKRAWELRVPTQNSTRHCTIRELLEEDWCLLQVHVLRLTYHLAWTYRVLHTFITDIIEERLRQAKADRKAARLNLAVSVTAPASTHDTAILAKNFFESTNPNHVYVPCLSPPRGPPRAFFHKQFPNLSPHQGPPSNEETFHAAVMKSTTCSLPSSSLTSPVKQVHGPLSPLPQPGRVRCKLLRPPPMVVRPSTSEVAVQTTSLNEQPVGGASYEIDISLFLTLLHLQKPRCVSQQRQHKQLSANAVVCT